jgi:hypothetical protein
MNNAKWLSLLSVLIMGVTESFATPSPNPTTIPKAQASNVKTECRVVATEAKRLVPGFTSPDRPDLYSRELWARISEDVNTITVGDSFTVNVLDLFSIDKGRDALSNGSAPSLGWKPQYIDTLTPGANQRHHYGFHFFSSANDGGLTFVASLIGTTVNRLNDFVSGNTGDLNLSDEATREGSSARTAGGVGDNWQRVKGALCVP